MTFVVGMIMIYLPLFLDILTHMRRFHRLLLTLPFCVLLISCDSYSASPISNTDGDKIEIAKQALISDRNIGENERRAEEQSVSTADYSEYSGESLMNAANSTDKTRRAPMFSESNDDSMLQATLIGDYVGMLPCSFCDGIALTLNLFADGSVLKTSIYKNPKSPKVPLIESGIYRQDSDTITIVYTDKHIEIYNIQDNHLVMLDNDKTPDPDYTLSPQ